MSEPEEEILEEQEQETETGFLDMLELFTRKRPLTDNELEDYDETNDIYI